ncbi:DUF116 domain-containing protein [Dethiothermospora halolimnae]|uniref:DUF116 domain-containing protein n=1 Tax=Dethiothermospora halolimnae TaxID=3114390 RepID=UPI003CCC31F0
MKKDEKTFIFSTIFIVMLMVILGGTILYTITSNDMDIIKVILSIALILLSILILIGIWTTYIIYRIIKYKKVNNVSYKYIKKFLKIMYPMLNIITKLFKIDKDVIRRVYSDINNLLVESKDIKVNDSRILILLPHCLQEAKCQYKITNDINNCRKCGRCDINDILILCEKYNVEAIVATGGTLAREWIKRKGPKAIIAVACERDLVSGINDVDKIPVLGVFNERPNGPCYNTKVDVNKLEKAIKNFLKEE